MAATERVDDAAERRRRACALLDATTPGRSLAVGRCKLALETFRSDRGGGGLREAGTLLGDALFCSNVHHPAIYHAWIGMEVEAGTDATRVRELFEGWRIWYLRVRGARNRDDDGEEEERRPSQDEGGFWCHYIDFELRHGTAATARQVRQGGAAPGVPRSRHRRALESPRRLRRGRENTRVAGEGGDSDSMRQGS
ncbi:unnamed protein product [Miscanthus lutarioriparius]|uniref:Uncharacterized protein n=1 Tax=Miscanthus lutarioriparius TaxID=422564 RepID=A0A811R2M6_9POAL|nr:unnamed protein product [Miscanthus lutarioriparius]